MSKKHVVFIIVVYLFFSSGHIEFFDTTASIETALSIANNGRIGTNIPHPLLYKQGRFNYWYTKLGLSLPVLYIPSVLISKALARLEFPEEVIRNFFISLVNSILTAFIVLLIFKFVKLRNSNAALFFAILAGFGTQLLPYSKTTLREPLQALALLGAFVFLSKEMEKPILAGIFTAIGLLTKQTFIVFLLPLLILVFWEKIQKKFLFFIPIVVSILIWMIYSYYAWFNPFDTGYSKNVTTFSPIVWKYSFWEGLWLEVFSYEKGLFFYNPILILFPIILILKILKKSLSIFDLCVLIAIILQLSLYAKWFSPVGDAALGPRYCLVIIPLMVIFLDYKEIFQKKFLKIGIITFTFVSIIFQVVQSSIKIQEYYTLFNEAKHEPSIPQWHANLVFFIHKLKGHKEVYNLKSFGAKEDRAIDLTRFKSLEGFNYWWLHIWKLKNFKDTSNKT